MRKTGSKLPETLVDSAKLVEGADCPKCGERLTVRPKGGVPDVTCTRCGARVMLGTVEIKFEVYEKEVNK